MKKKNKGIGDIARDYKELEGMGLTYKRQAELIGISERHYRRLRKQNKPLLDRERLDKLEEGKRKERDALYGRKFDRDVVRNRFEYMDRLADRTEKALAVKKAREQKTGEKLGEKSVFEIVERRTQDAWNLGPDARYFGNIKSNLENAIANGDTIEIPVDIRNNKTDEIVVEETIYIFATDMDDFLSQYYDQLRMLHPTGGYATDYSASIR